MRGVGLADHIEFLIRSFFFSFPLFSFSLFFCPRKSGEVLKGRIEGSEWEKVMGAKKRLI